MHRLYRSLGVVLVFVCMAGSLYGHNGDYTAYAIPLRDITVDGKLDDWPARMAVYPIDWVSPLYYKRAPPTGPEDISASFRVGYDEVRNVLYVALVVYDESLVIDPDPATGSYHNQDLCELYIDADHSGDDAAIINARKAQQYAMVGGPSLYADSVDSNPALIAGNTKGAGVEAVFLRLGNYSVYEWAVPLWASFPEQRYQIKAGKTIGFDVAINDTDDLGELGNWVAWTPDEGKNSDSNRIGDVKFVSVYTGLDLVLEPVMSQELRQLVPTLTTVSGRLSRGDSKGMWADVLVQLHNTDGKLVAVARSDSLGRYRYEVPAGSYRLSVEYAANNPLALELFAGEHRVVDDLIPALVQISGRVTLAGDGPSGGIAVFLSKDSTDAVEHSVLTDSTGGYRFLAVPGSYEIALGTGENRQMRSVAELHSGTIVDAVDFENFESGNRYFLWPLALIFMCAGIMALAALVPLYRCRIQLGGVLLAPVRTFAYFATQSPQWQVPFFLMVVWGLSVGGAYSFFSPLPTVNTSLVEAIGLLLLKWGVFPCFVVLGLVGWLMRTSILWGVMRIAGQKLSFYALLCHMGYALIPECLFGAVSAALYIIMGYWGEFLRMGINPDIKTIWVHSDLMVQSVAIKSILLFWKLCYGWSMGLTIVVVRAISTLNPMRTVLVLGAYLLIVLGITGDLSAGLQLLDTVLAGF